MGGKRRNSSQPTLRDQNCRGGKSPGGTKPGYNVFALKMMLPQLQMEIKCNWQAQKDAWGNTGELEGNKENVHNVKMNLAQKWDHSFGETYWLLLPVMVISFCQLCPWFSRTSVHRSGQGIGQIRLTNSYSKKTCKAAAQTNTRTERGWKRRLWATPSTGMQRHPLRIVGG